MSVQINSPRGGNPGDTVTSLNVTVSVSWDLTSGDRFDGVTYQLACQITDLSGQAVSGGGPATFAVAAGSKGTHLFSFTLSQAGDYAVDTSLTKITTTSSGSTPTLLADDNQSPIHVSNAGGVIFSGSFVHAHAQAKAATKLADAPVVLKGVFPVSVAQPVTGVVMDIYHVEPGDDTKPSTEVLDYRAIPTVLGSSLLDSPDGTVRVGTIFSVVFPADARMMNRQFRLYLLGILGEIVLAVPGPVT